MLCIATVAHGDRQPGSLSTIKTNANTGAIEVIHRLHNHDAELGIATARVEQRRVRTAAGRAHDKADHPETAAAIHNAPRSDAIRIIIGWVSGSPKRQLYSITLGWPALSIIKPA